MYMSHTVVFTPCNEMGLGSQYGHAFVSENTFTFFPSEDREEEEEEEKETKTTRRRRRRRSIQKATKTKKDDWLLGWGWGVLADRGYRESFFKCTDVSRRSCLTGGQRRTDK